MESILVQHDIRTLQEHKLFHNFTSVAPKDLKCIFTRWMAYVYLAKNDCIYTTHDIYKCKGEKRKLFVKISRCGLSWSGRWQTGLLTTHGDEKEKSFRSNLLLQKKFLGNTKMKRIYVQAISGLRAALKFPNIAVGNFGVKDAWATISILKFRRSVRGWTCPGLLYNVLLEYL